MLDGVCETFTAAMSAPYLDGHGHVTDHAGSCSSTRRAAGGHRQLAAAGFQLHFHAIGDRAVSAALDALATLPTAQRRRPPPPRAPAVHHPGGPGRFAKLRITGNFQPLWACGRADGQADHPVRRAERAAWQYRIGSLLRLGTRVAFGSDWPVSSADPLQEMHVAVNRMLSGRLGTAGIGRDDRAVAARQAIGVDAAIDAFTKGVAWVNHEEDVAGRLLPGKVADLAVLDQNLYAIPPKAIGDTSVAMTIAGGHVVHGDE